MGNELQDKKFLTVGTHKIQVFPYLNLEYSGKSFSFMRENDLKYINTNSAILAKVGLIRRSEAISAYFPYFGKDKEFTNGLKNNFLNWDEYIAMGIQNLFADGLEGEGISKVYQTGEKYYNIRSRVGDSTEIPK
ncbi:MAG: hypothetical protein R3C61_28510 [Bacteroidia bacterium]